MDEMTTATPIITPPLEFPRYFSNSNHKTVFLLDHTPYFGISSGIPVIMDPSYGHKSGEIPVVPVCKSLWTCTVEAALDYCRIVWDIFPEGKLIRLIISDSQAHSTNGWACQHQNIYQVFGRLQGLGAPPRTQDQDSSSSVIHGFRTTIEAMCECSEAQRSPSYAESKLPNNCRLICVTSTRDNESIKNLEDIFQNEFNRVMRVVEKTDASSPIDHCHLIIVNIFPSNAPQSVTGHAIVQKAGNLTCEVYSCQSDRLAAKMADLLLEHYDLGSTTVTGIPMKEEQNASASANYNVEIFHVAQAHDHLAQFRNSPEHNSVYTSKEGTNYETIILKWSMTRNTNAADLYNCNAIYRITPAEVSRPSACLTAFLLGGRSVLLESANRSANKGVSHVLCSYGGEIYIQTINTGRLPLEHSPSISEGRGGRVTDYRIADFGHLLQKFTLVPQGRAFEKMMRTMGCDANDKRLQPLSNAKLQLEKWTKVFPLTVSSNAIFNYKNVTEPFLSIMPKERITREDVVQCMQCIYNLVSMEAKNEALTGGPAAATIAMRKSSKREEMYKTMWNELEAYAKTHSYSEEHEEVLKCLQDCRKKPAEAASKLQDKKEMMERALKGPLVERTSRPSPLSPPHSASSSFTQDGDKKKSFFDHMMERRKPNLKFAGQSEVKKTAEGYAAKLYKQNGDRIPQKPKPLMKE